MKTTCKEKILIVDDDPIILNLLMDYLKEFGCQVSTSTNGREALECLHEESFPLTITDIHMPLMDGVQLIDAVRREGIATQIIVITSDADKETLADIISAGAYDYLAKPFSIVELEAKLRRFDRERKMQAEIEEKRKLEERLLYAQKMEAVGTLASGIAHDFNNILSAVNGFSELGLMLEDIRGSEAAEYFYEIQKAGQRAAKLIRQILVFSRQSDEDFTPVQLVSIIKEAVKLLRATIPTTIEIKQHITAECAEIMVMADQTMIHQIIMNLCTNAYQSMKVQGGVLEVNLTEKEMSFEDIKKRNITLRPGSYLVLEIKDNGPGIRIEVLKRIFEPYYTTKERGEGTGLGLAVVDGIVKKHGGDITVQSRLGNGSIFQVYLPVTISRAGPEMFKTVTPIPAGHEHILFVDDEETILSLNQKAYSSLGYKVTIVSSGAEAMRTFSQHPQDIDIVVTDMAMPKMNGVELTLKLLAVRQDLPVIICTGFSEMVDEEMANQIGAMGFLMKPVSLMEQAGLIRQVLDECSSR